MHRNPSHPAASTGAAVRRRVRRGAVSATAISALALCGLVFTALPAGAASGGSVNLVSYSTPKPAYSALAAAFAKTKAGAGVTVSSSFGGSGTQADPVIDGLPRAPVELPL